MGIGLFFFDKYNNAITSENDVKALTVATEFAVTDVLLCVTPICLKKIKIALDQILLNLKK